MQIPEKLVSTFAELQQNGFIHVTGLRSIHPGNPELDSKRIINVRRKDWGSWGTNNEMMVVALPEGYVWIRRLTDGDNRYKLEDIASKYCPRGRSSVYVPCSNGEAPPVHHIIARAGNPMWHGWTRNNDHPADPEVVEDISYALAGM